MAYRIKKSVDPERITLSDLDPDEETYVIIAHADGNDQLRIENIIAGSSYVYQMEGVGQVREQMPSSPYMERCTKAWVTIKECNIEDENGDPLFKTNMEWDDFRNAWGKLDDAARSALYSAVVKVNPHWSFMIGGVI